MKPASLCLISAVAAAFMQIVLAMPTSNHKGTPTLRNAANESAPDFAADPSINVAGIYAAAQASSTNILATYPTNAERKAFTNIYSDWNFTDVSAFHFIADMDTDCDGPQSNCKVNNSTQRRSKFLLTTFGQGNRDGQKATSFGALDATKVPYFVLPERFTLQYKPILKDNALGAIICGGKMFYGIYGDQDADSPEVIGEASILIGQTCFPDGIINGGNGHAENDVAYIVFGDQVPAGVEKSSIDIPALKALGDAQMKLLEAALHL
ncbi:fungal chitosanase of glycosyl hydrolase group 75-domain-containing protein [Mycena vitilis]|nr:fungal chitosanase of glycosyl hydrolase group 75-domain-containing protein [Mycena vitilis]